MAKSKGRLLAELLAADGKVKEEKSALDITGGKLAPADIPTLPNSKLENSSITIAGESIALGGSVSLNTGHITEHTNFKYHTDSRVRSAISASKGGGHGSISYNSSTGAITVTGVSTEEIQDVVGSMFTNNTESGITVTYDDSDGTIDLSVAALSTSSVSEGSNLYYTDARARAAISATGSLSYNSSTGVMSFTMPGQNTSNITEGSNLYYTDARADARIAAADTGDLSEGSNLYHTTARARAAISATGSLSYNSSTGVMSFTMPAQNTSNITEGSNLYFTNARADARIANASLLPLAGGTLTGTLNGTSASFSGNIAVTGTVDGRDVATDGTKLDTIATNANYITNNNQLTNGAGYITSAASNITGRLSDSNMPSVIGGSQSTTFIGALGGNASTATQVQATATGGAQNSSHYLAFFAANGSGSHQPIFTAASLSYNPSTRVMVINGNVVWNAGNDGAGSALDADLLDGQHGSYYLNYNNFSNTPSIPSLSGYATESYVNTQVSNLVDSAPGTLNTLNELAAALGDDANFSTTVTTSIAAKLPLAGGTMTGAINMGSQNISAINNATAVSFLSTNGYWVGGVQRMNGTGNLLNIGTITSAAAGTILDASHNLTNINNVYASGYRIGSTTVIDASRNITSADIHIKSGTGGTNTQGLLFTLTDNADAQAYIKKTAYYMHYNAHYNEGHRFTVNGTDDMLRMHGSNNGTRPDSIDILAGNGLYMNNTQVMTQARALTNVTGNISMFTNDSGYITSADGGNATTLDGIDSSSFLRSDANDTASGALTLTNSGNTFRGHLYFSEHSTGRHYIHFNTGHSTNQIDWRIQTNNTNSVIHSWTNTNAYFATQVQTATQGILWGASNDGSGSGLDADTVDGYQVGDSANNAANKLVITEGNGYISSNYFYTSSNDNGTTAISRIYASQDGYIRYYTPTNFRNNLGLWWSGNDGSGSGLDADTLDGINSSSFLRSDAQDAGGPSASNYLNIQYLYNNKLLIGNGTTSFTDHYNDSPWYGIGRTNVDGWYSGQNKAQMAFYWGLVLRSAQARIELGPSSNGPIQFGDGGTTNFARINSTGIYQGTSNLVWHAGNDGSGSSLDSDLLDGQHGSYYYSSANPPPTYTKYLRSDVHDTGVGLAINGGTLNQTHDSTLYVTAGNNNDWGITIGAASGKTEYGMQIQMPSSFSYALRVLKNGSEHFNINSTGATIGGNYIWHAGNDGSGSGLDADTVDGVHASSFLTSYSETDTLSSVTGRGASTGTKSTFSGGASIAGTNHTRSIPTKWYGTAYTNTDIDYYEHNHAKAQLGNTYKYTTSRPVLTSDTNYWVGSMGWGNNDLNTVFSWGSGFWDSWSSPNNSPGGTTHWTGLNALHYSANTGNTQYGMQMTMGAGNTNLMYVRGIWGGGFGSWQKMWNAGNDGSGSGLDADLLDGQEGSYYAPASTVPTVHNGTLTVQGAGSVSGSGTFTANSSANTTITLTGTGLTSYTETDTLATVVGRGDTTTATTKLRGGGSHLGNHEFAASSTSTSYSAAAIELRESNYTSSGSATPPQLGFHWGNIVASNIALDSGGAITIRDNPGTSFQNFRANNIYASGTNAVMHVGNDGSGSGYDADLLDGVHGSSFFRSDADDAAATNIKTTLSVLKFTGEGTSSGSVNNSYAIYQESGAWTHPYPDLIIGFHTGIKIGAYHGYGGTRFYNNNPTSGTIIASIGDGDNHFRGMYEGYLKHGTSTEYKIWTAGNDGSNSGLDADLLDGQEGAYYAPASSIPTVGNGTITINAGTNMSGGGSFTVNQSGNTTITLNSTASGGGSSLDSVTAFHTVGPSNAANSSGGATAAALTNISTTSGQGASNAGIMAFNTAGVAVRDMQEQTFKVTRAQMLAAFSGGSTGNPFGEGLELLAPAGVGKCIVVYDLIVMVEFTGPLTTSGGVGSQALLSGSTTLFDIRSRYKSNTTGNYGQITRYAVIEATNTTQTGSSPYYGFIYRDLPTGTTVQQRILAPNQSVFLHKTSSIGNVGTNLTALYIKLRYKIYDGATF